MKILTNTANQPSLLVNGELLALTLEVMNKISPCEMNSEFYASEQELQQEMELSSNIEKINDLSNMINFSKNFK